MGFEPNDNFGILRRPTAIGVAAQDLGKGRGSIVQSLTVGQRPSMKPFCHDLDTPAYAQILNADLAQSEIEMSKHGVEEGLGQDIAIGLAAQPVDHQRGMERQRVEATVQSVGYAAGFEELRRARLLGHLAINGHGKLVLGLSATEHEWLPPQF